MQTDRVKPASAQRIVRQAVAIRDRLTALADLGLGFSLEVWQRIGLQLFVAGNARMSLTDLPASSINFPVTGVVGTSLTVAPALNLEIGVYYDHTRPPAGAAKDPPAHP